MSKENKLYLFPHVGMRKVKSLITLFICFWIWQAIRLVFPDLEIHPIYMYMYSIIEIRDSSEKTVNFGKRRIKAMFTAFGVGLPLLAVSDLIVPYISADWVKVGFDLFLILFGSLVCIGVAEKVGCQTFCGLAAAMFIVLAVSHADDGRYMYAILRALQTLIAIAMAWLINVKLFPYPRKPKKVACDEVLTDTAEPGEAHIA